MTDRSSTRLGAPGPVPLGAASLRTPGVNGTSQPTPAGTASMTLGTLREVRNELVQLGELLDRMSGEMAGLRRAVETVAARDASAPDRGTRETSNAEAGRAARKAAKRAAKDAATQGEREASLTARVDKLERQVAKMRRRLDWMG